MITVDPRDRKKPRNNFYIALCGFIIGQNLTNAYLFGNYWFNLSLATLGLVLLVMYWRKTV